jgi:hypothetical protein
VVASSTRRKAQKVFLDANVVIRAGKPPGKPVMDSIGDLVTSGFITVFTTDLTKIEVAKHHTNRDLDEIAGLGRTRFRKLTKQAIGVELPEISAEDLRKKVFDQYMIATEDMFKNIGAKTLPIDDVKPSAVFESYNHRTGVFGKEAKKDQFPDAFIFERIRSEGSANDEIMVVSDDGDFAAAAKDTKYVKHLRTVADLFGVWGCRARRYLP